MAEEFEFQDLSDAVFWGVDLSRARFRDVDLTDVAISHARMVNVDIDGVVEHVTINGVDVTGFVNEHDPWFPLRSMLRPTDPAGMRRAWAELEQTWGATIDRAGQLPSDLVEASVDGEWSFVETLRHLVFVMDKWFCVPVLGDPDFHPFAIPNSGSRDFGWPGLQLDSTATYTEVLAVRAGQDERFRGYLAGLTPGEMTRDVEVLENGHVTVGECLATVFEEAFEHHRYATRDLARVP